MRGYAPLVAEIAPSEAPTRGHRVRIAKEVIADLDLQEFTWGVVSEIPAVNTPYTDGPAIADSEVESKIHREITNAAEAAAYMQQVALKLRNWRESMGKASDAN